MINLKDPDDVYLAFLLAAELDLRFRCSLLSGSISFNVGKKQSSKDGRKAKLCLQEDMAVL